jgi:hypothetical protein
VADRIVANNNSFIISDLNSGALQKLTVVDVYKSRMHKDTVTKKIEYDTSFDIEKLGVNITSLDVMTNQYIYIFVQIGKYQLDLFRYYDNSMKHWMSYDDSLPPYGDINKIINAFTDNYNLLYIVTTSNVVYCIDLHEKGTICALYSEFPIVYACMDVYRKQVYLVHEDYNRNKFVTVYNGHDLNRLYDIEYFGTSFVVNNGTIFVVSGNKITIYHTAIDNYQNGYKSKLIMLESHVIDSYPNDVESVFAVTTSETGVLIVAGYDQDRFHTLQPNH